MKLTPVQGDPFAGSAAGGPTLKPVEGDPFAPKTDDRPIEQSWLETVDDWAQSIGSGAISGIEGTLGLPGLAERGVDWVADKTAGLITGKGPTAEEQRGHILPTPSDIAGVVGLPTTRP